MTLDRLYRDVENLKQQYKGLAGGPQLALSSIENGAIDSMDADGNLKMTIGQQDDGGNTINVISGPTPPTPVRFTVDVDHGKFIVHWSGDFDGDALAPSDWSRAEVHASQDPFFVPDRTTARGSIVSAAGGEVTIGVLKGPWTIKMLAWSQAGKMSAPSAPVDVEVPGYGDIVLEEIDAATTLIKNAGEMLLEGQQTLADKLAGIADLDPEEISDEIAQARQEAIDAALAEIANVEGTLTSAIGGKSTTTWSTSNPPANYDGAVGDTWVKLTSLGSGGREIRRSRWQGDVWVDHPVDGAVLSNVDASTITTGFLDVVNRIRAGAIMGDKLLIGGPTNLIANPGFELGADGLLGWSSTGNAAATSDQKRSGAKSVLFPDNTQTAAVAENQTIRVTEGDKLAASVWIRLSDAAVGTGSFSGGFRIHRVDTGAEISTGWAGNRNFPRTLPANEWAQYTGEWTSPYTGDIYFRIAVATGRRGDMWLDDIQFRPMVGGTLITPGGVQTPHLAADVLEVSNLKAGTAALAEAVIKKLFAEVVVARMAQAEEFIGENALLTNSVTAPKIVASEELWAKLGQFVKIRAEHIQSDALDFMVARGGTYLTSGGNGSWSDNGLFISSPDGTSLVRFPTDGTPLSLTASDVQIDRASIGELDVIEETVRSGGTLNLASGVTPPASPPELSLGWEPVAEFDRPSPGSSFDWLGLGAWGTKWVRAVNVLGSVGDTLDAFEVYSAAGSFEKKISLDINPRAGVTVIGDVAYTIGPDQNPANAGKLWVHGFNLNTGVRVTRWQFTRFTLSNQAKIAIGNDGTNLVVAGVHPTSNTLYVMRYNPATGAQVGADMTDTSYDVQYTKELQGVYITGSVAYVAHAKDTRRYSISGGTLTRTDNGWRNPETDAAGLAFTTTPFLVAQSGELYRGSTFQDSTFEACYTWWDGTHETTPSPIAALDMQAARVVSVSLARRAGLQKRFYYRSGNGNWARQTLDQDVTSVTIYTPNPSANNYPPPTANSFPNADPALLTSTNQRFQVLGDGSGKWGPLTFNADGTMTSTAIPSWIPVTSFLNGSAPASFGFAPAYRIWPDGKVEWRGCVSVNNVTGMTEIITVPAAAVPAQFVPRPVSCNGGSGGGIAHAEIAQPGIANRIRTRPVSGTLAWISLDSFSYYLT